MKYTLPPYPFPHTIDGLDAAQTEAVFVRALEIRDTPVHQLAPEDAAKLLLARTLMRESFGHYVRWQIPDYKWGRHHVALVIALEAMERKEPEARWLCASCPVRAGKTLLCSILFPGWALGRNASTEWLIFTFANDLAEELGRKARTLILSKSWDFIFGDSCRLDDTSQSVTQLRTLGTRGDGIAPGSLLWCSRGAPPTGRGGNVILDDMLRDNAEACSTSIKAELHEVIDYAAFTRLPPGGTVLSISSRFAVDDATGYLLNAQGSTFKHLQFKAIDEDGDALHPERYDEAEYSTIRNKVGSRVWNFLYQGEPSLRDNGFFREQWFQTFNMADVPQNSRLVLSADLAKTDTGDNQAIGVFALAENMVAQTSDMYCLGMYVFKATLSGAVDRMCQLLQQFGTHARKVEVLVFEKDGIADGPYVRERLFASGHRQRIEYLSAARSKLVKSQTAQAAIENGSMRFRESAQWLPGLITECIEFTGDKGGIDDQVDVLSNVARAVAERRVRPRIEPAANVYAINGGSYDPKKPFGGDVRMGLPGSAEDYQMRVLSSAENDRY